MIFNLIEQNIFFILFLILTALIIAVCLNMFRLLKKKEEKFPSSKDFTKVAETQSHLPPYPQSTNELFFRISEDFQEKLNELINQEIEKNLLEFKKEIQKTSGEIIANYKSQFESGNQEIQKVIFEFFQQASKEIPNLLKSTLRAQREFSENAENKISELNQATKNELVKIQGINLKAHDLLINEVKKESAELLKDIAQKFNQIYQSTSETLNKKVVETEMEIKNYKKEELKEIDRKIYQMIGEVAKKTIGKTIDLSAHEKLVIEVLEKAKKENFFKQYIDNNERNI